MQAPHTRANGRFLYVRILTAYIMRNTCKTHAWITIQASAEEQTAVQDEGKDDASHVQGGKLTATS